MALSPKTVAYQETSNNYADIRQQIKGTQIASVKVFGASPSGSGDYQGQFAIANPVPAITNFYVWSGVEWAHVASSDTTSLPDTVVQENIDNNFTNPHQQILNCPIMYMDRGVGAPTTPMIKGPGHVYIQEVDPVKVFMTVDGMDWIQMRTHDDTGDYVVRDQPNDFTDNGQSISGRPIVSVTQHSVNPVDASIAPERIGQIFVQLADGTIDKRARMWIANPDGGLHWEEVVAPVPTMVRTDRDNDFAVVEQKLNGRQILSFVDGGDQTPQQSGLRPDYDGQAYIAVRTLVGTGNKSVGVWIANGNAWLPILEDNMASTLVRTDKPNYFSDVNQFLGTGPDARQISGTRIKRGGLSPVTDSQWRTNCVGEICVWENDNVSPHQYSVWVSVLQNASTTSNAGEWQLLWSSVTGAGENVAKTDKSNRFCSMQYISDGAKDHLITVAREGGTEEPNGRILPMSAGEFYAQTVGGGMAERFWMSAAASDTDSWHRIYTDQDPDVVMADRPNTFTDNNLFTMSAGKRDRITGARMMKPTGVTSHTGTPIDAVTPTMFGEMLVSEIWADVGDEKTAEIVIWMAVGMHRKSWVEVGRVAKNDMVVGDPGNPVNP